MKFTGLDTKPENADIFAAMEFAPGQSTTNAVSIQVDTNLMTDAVSPNITVMGSNISLLEADMVAVRDEALNSGAVNLQTPFVKAFFPYKYIGVKYVANTNAGAGTFTVMIEQKSQKVN